MSLDDLRKFQLPGGMKFICRRNSANPTVSLNFKFSSGSIVDPPSKAGLAGFAGSLITKGTARRKAADIAEAIDSIGMELGFSTGGHTSSLVARVLAENLRPALKLITEIISDPHPPRDEMERMRERILTGIKMSLDDPAAVATNKMAEMIYGAEHPYGRPLELKLKTLPSIALEDIHGYYSEHILPGSAIGIIVGDIDLVTIESVLKETVGKWRGEGEFSVAPPPPVDLPENPHRTEILMPGKTQSDVALGFRGITRKDPSYYALLVGNTVLGRLSLGGRIGRRVRDTEGMAYYAFTSFDAGIGPGPYVFRAGVNPVNVDRAVDLAIEEMIRAKKEGITADEMADAVVFLSGSMARQVETNGGMAATMISQELYGLGDDYYLRFGDILGTLTLDEVNAALAGHLHPEHYCLAVAGPEV